MVWLWASMGVPSQRGVDDWEQVGSCEGTEQWLTLIFKSCLFSRKTQGGFLEAYKHYLREL